MRIQSAVIIAQAITFMIVAVPKPVLDDQQKAEQTIHFLQARWVGMPLALVTCDECGTPTAYYGPGDLALHLLRIPPTAVPWKDLSIP
jgi:hypothetical protein